MYWKYFSYQPKKKRYMLFGRLEFLSHICKINSYSPLGLSLSKFSKRLVFQKDKNLKKERRKKEKNPTGDI